MLIFALGYMGYRGDFGHRPEAPSLSPTDRILNTHPTLEPEPENFDRKIREESRQTKVGEVIVKHAKAKPFGLEVFSSEKSAIATQTMWLESHKVQEERTMLDKLLNLASFGKFE